MQSLLRTRDAASTIAPLSSLTTNDAIAYRALLRRSVPAALDGPPRSSDSAERRPSARGLTVRCAAYVLAVLRALCAWLVGQHYVITNPFAGVMVRCDTPHS